MKGISRCVCGSMPPGMTYDPEASITSQSPVSCKSSMQWVSNTRHLFQAFIECSMFAGVWSGAVAVVLHENHRGCNAPQGQGSQRLHIHCQPCDKNASKINAKRSSIIITLQVRVYSCITCVDTDTSDCDISQRDVLKGRRTMCYAPPKTCWKMNAESGV